MHPQGVRQDRVYARGVPVRGVDNIGVHFLYRGVDSLEEIPLGPHPEHPTIIRPKWGSSIHFP